MASGILALLDDVAALMDDVAVIGKLATKKTAGILGDDLAVNAEKATGFPPSRELPVIWQITKGSFINKMIILPAAFILSILAPWLIVPVLIAGGVYLAYEGAEKIFEWLIYRFSSDVTHSPAKETGHSYIETSPDETEREKIKSAIRTDFILSIEIVIVAIGTVTDQPIWIQMVVVSFVALLATIGVYGLVAALVKMDDLGLKLVEIGRGQNRILEKLGIALIKGLPLTIRMLGIIGTLAMLMVAGGIFIHNIHLLHPVTAIPSPLAEILTGGIIGILALSAQQGIYRIKRKFLRTDRKRKTDIK